MESYPNRLQCRCHQVWELPSRIRTIHSIIITYRYREITHRANKVSWEWRSQGRTSRIICWSVPKDSLGDMHDDVTPRVIGRHIGRVAPASEHLVPRSYRQSRRSLTIRALKLYSKFTEGLQCVDKGVQQPWCLGIGHFLYVYVKSSITASWLDRQQNRIEVTQVACRSWLRAKAS